VLILQATVQFALNLGKGSFKKYGIQLSAGALLPTAQTGDSCPNCEIGATGEMSESGSQRKSAVL